MELEFAAKIGLSEANKPFLVNFVLINFTVLFESFLDQFFVCKAESVLEFKLAYAS